MRGEEGSLYCLAMILAGIDEAGYGPLLGPLVVGCCAFEVPDDAAATSGAAKGDSSIPCLWKRLRRIVSKSRDKKGRKLHVNDSKQVYSPAAGLRELERSVLALVSCLESDATGKDCINKSTIRCGEATAAKPSPLALSRSTGRGEGNLRFALEEEARLERFLAAVAADALVDLAGYAWYAPFEGERFPIEADATSGRLMANALRGEMEKNGVRCVHLAARIVSERRLNAMIERTRNKSSVLFSTSAIHLDHLLRNFGEKKLVIFCDRQGGREHYGSLLRMMFEEWSLEVIEEKDGRSEYRLIRGEHSVRLLWREKAEAQCMPTAIASMLSKYAREALMGRFNAWWKQHLPELEPTAGYYSDGVRFLRDIEEKRRVLAIGDGDLIRAR